MGWDRTDPVERRQFWAKQCLIYGVPIGIGMASARIAKDAATRSGVRSLSSVAPLLWNRSHRRRFDCVCGRVADDTAKDSMNALRNAVHEVNRKMFAGNLPGSQNEGTAFGIALAMESATNHDR